MQFCIKIIDYDIIVINASHKRVVLLDTWKVATSNIDIFYKRNILEAHEQLKISEMEYQGKKPVIKIFLLYESMTNTQIVMSSIPEIFVDDSRCYIMTIEDLEMMLVTYKNDKENLRR